MFKKLKMTLMALVSMPIISSQCLSATPPSIPGASASFDGAYAGINLGLLYENVNNTYIDTVGSNTFKTKKYGFITGAFGGYLLEIGASRTMVGLETFVLVSNAKFNSNFGPSSSTVYGVATVKRKSSVGLTGILAKMFNVRTLIFLKLGFETINYSIDLNYDPGTVAPFAGKTKTLNPKLTGAIIGIGLDYRFMPSVVVGAEYIFAGLFRKKKLTIDSSSPDSILRMKPTEHKLMLRVSYRFGLML